VSQWIRDRRIGTKLLLSFGLVSLITVAVGVVGLVGASRLGDRLEEVGAVRLPSVAALGRTSAGRWTRSS
jgi:hypothetical protein